jgi:membrane-bound metal-dependent hydrolase YbcI (DUF457 family)
MRTYTHGIIGYLLYLSSSKKQKILAIIGAMIPDIFLIIGFIFHFAGESTVAKSLHNIFHRSLLHTITEIMHSFVIIIPLGMIAWILYKEYLPFFIGMFSHAILDLISHQEWAYNHFWPFPLEPLMGLFSYTSLWFTIIEHLGVLIFVLWILRNNYFNNKNKTFLSK